MSKLFSIGWNLLILKVLFNLKYNYILTILQYLHSIYNINSILIKNFTNFYKFFSME